MRQVGDLQRNSVEDLGMDTCGSRTLRPDSLAKKRKPKHYLCLMQNLCTSNNSLFEVRADYAEAAVSGSPLTLHPKPQTLNWPLNPKTLRLTLALDCDLVLEKGSFDQASWAGLTRSGS